MSYRNSPSNEKMFHIKEEINEIDVEKEIQRKNKLDNLEKKTKKFDEDMKIYSEKLEQNITEIKKTITNLQNIIDEERLKNEKSLEEKKNKINILETKLMQMTRKNGENKIVSLIEEKSTYISNEITKEFKSTQENSENFTKTYENEIPKISKTIENEKNKREQEDETIFNNSNLEIQTLIDAFESEKKTREESETTIYDMVKDMINRIKSEIENERKARRNGKFAG